MNLKLNKNILLICVFFIVISYFLVSLVYYIPSIGHSDHYIFTSYSLSYEEGFNSRFLIGSIFQLFYRTVSFENIRRFVLFFLGLLITLTSIFITKIIMVGINKKKILVIVCAIIFMVFPASITYLFNYANFGRLDMYWVLIVFIIVLYSNKKFIHYLISPLIIIAIAIHQGFVFTYLPLVLVIQIYYFYKSRTSRFYLYNLMVTITIASIVFIYFQLLKPEIIDFDLFIYNTQLKTEFDIHKDMLVYEYIYTLRDHFWRFWRPNIRVLLIRTISALPILIPTYFTFFYIWLTMFKKSLKFKNMYLFIFLAPLFTLPLFVLTIDWGRWFAASLNVQFLSLLFLILNEEEDIIDFLSNLNMRIPTFAYVIITMYFLGFNKFISLGILDKFHPMDKLLEITIRFVK